MPEVRLIDANAAADKIMRDVETHADEIGIGAVAIMIAFARALRDETDFPTIEPEVRHGRWIECDYKTLENGEIESAYKAGLCCSECRTGFKKNRMTYKAFCPACGADMREEGADNG